MVTYGLGAGRRRKSGSNTLVLRAGTRSVPGCPRLRGARLRKQRLFRSVHPTNQKFTKTDLAKFENCWDQLPHIASLGAEKNFSYFTIRLQQRGRFQVTREYFERLVGMAILFRRTERIVTQQRFGGYRANIVYYTIAYLAHATSQQIDLDSIWRSQDISDALAEAIETVCYEVRTLLVDAPGNGNVTEWCKKEACWQRVRQRQIHLPRALMKELTNAVHDPGRMNGLVTDVLMQSSRPLAKREIVRRSGLPEQAWYTTIRTLLAQGRVVQYGTRSGAMYALADSA